MTKLITYYSHECDYKYAFYKCHHCPHEHQVSLDEMYYENQTIEGRVSDCQEVIEYVKVIVNDNTKRI